MLFRSFAVQITLGLMITSSTPESWRDLQNEVGRVLAECGFSVEVERTLTTVRGKVEIDVSAEEQVKGRKYTILCECKNWKARVPQSVVHGFRTVVGDIGANAGYIISSAGFQEGAYEAILNTNVRLLTWTEFQDAFEETWYEQHFYPTITERLDALFSYTEPFLPRWFDSLSDVRQKEFIALKERYQELGWVLMSFTTYSRMARKNADRSLPILKHLHETSTLAKAVPAEILNATTPREFLELIIPFGEGLIQQFRGYRPNEA